MGFRKITPHSQVCRNTIYLPPPFLLKKNAWTTLFGARGGEPYYAYSAEARPNENVCAALSERLPSSSAQRYFGGIVSCLSCAYNNFQNQTAAEIK